MAFIGGMFIAFIIALSVKIDANKRYKDSVIPLLWFFAVWAILIIFLPAYLIVRPPRLDQQ